jgi:metallo-beta-lactamase family protein
MPAPDYIVLESTYGNRTHQDQGVALKEFANIINRTVERGGKVIIPTFAIERAQELIFHLKTLMNEEKIPRLPVYVDSPMAVNATGVFNIHPECFNSNIQDQFISKGKNPFSVSSLHCVQDFKESLEVARSRKPCIILAANGMCESGRIINHLKYGVSNSRNTILIVGYQGEHTLGRDILEKEPVLTIEDDQYKLNAEVQSLSAFSSHGDFQEQLNWLKQVDTSKLKKIFIVHGDAEAQEFLKSYLTTSGYKNIEIIRNGVTYNL